jgi:hypothetical protein
MDKMYYETIDTLEKSGTNPEYIQGWVGGYLGNPKREEQRITDAYGTGYEDGRAGTTANAGKFKS